MLRPPALEGALRRLELDPVVDPERLFRRRRRHRRHPEPLVDRLGHHIGEIVLALRVVGRERGHPSAKRFRGGGDDPRTDLADRPLGRARIAVLDDADDPPVGIAPHPAVAVRPVHGNGEERDPARSGLGLEPAERAGIEARHVAVEDHHPAPVGDEGQRLGECMSGTEGPGLLHPADRRRAGLQGGLDPGTDGIATIHDVDRGGIEGPSGFDHPGEEGTPRRLLENLGAAGPHPLAVAGRENDDLEVHHARRPPPPGMRPAKEPPSPQAGRGPGSGLRPARSGGASAPASRSWATASASSARAFA